MKSADQSHIRLDALTENYLEAMQACHELRWQDAIALFENEPEDSLAFGMAIGNKGQALLALNHFAEAEPCLRRSLCIIGSKGCPHPPSEIQFCRNLAEAVGRQGRWGESLDSFSVANVRSQEILQQFPQERVAIRLQQAHVFNAWGNSLLNLRRWDEAIEQYERARAIYGEVQDVSREGYAQMLTNLALALTKLDKFTRAELALREALDCAYALADDDQACRVKMAAIQMRSTIVPAPERLQTLFEAVDCSTQIGQLPTAYLRCCVGAEFAAEILATDEGMKFIERANELEAEISESDPHIAMLRGTEAELLRQKEASDATIIPGLIDGARRWYERIGAPIVDIDFAAVTRSMHNHFRMLSRHLINQGRLMEALAAFEAGRSLLHYRETNSDFLVASIRRNPFAAARDSVDVAAVRDAQTTIRKGECAVVLAVLPPELVAFVVWTDRIEVVAAPWPTTLPEGEALFDATRMVPHRLNEGVGSRSIPAQYHEFASRLLRTIGATCICNVTPYSILHAVPWRAVLRAQGAPWHQLAFPIGFGFLLRAGMPPAQSLDGVGVVTLGHGTAGAIDLTEESRRFAAPFGKRGEIATSSRALDVRAALNSGSIVHLSCHGKASSNGQCFTLEVAGEGRDTVLVEIHKIVPDRVNCPLAILSACESGVYEMQWGEFPTGVAPLLLQRGAQRCIGSRFLLRAAFANEFFAIFARELASGRQVEDAFADCLATAEASGRDLWRDIACVELLGGA